MHFSTTFGAPKEKFIDPLKSFLLLVADNFQTDKIHPPGKSAEATNAMKSLFQYSNLNKEQYPYLFNRGIIASLFCIFSFFIFQIESFISVLINPSLSMFVNASTFGLHSVTIFILSFYRIVQNFPLLV